LSKKPEAALSLKPDTALFIAQAGHRITAQATPNKAQPYPKPQAKKHNPVPLLLSAAVGAEQLHG
jgi:hypothetical protein